ncbi:MAG: hypothetical protein JWM80_6646 [Cyanobacteria bacterium RYN_339]|nr:hypothetical protein [Cyanobacteria bacterium RYN_339]
MNRWLGAPLMALLVGACAPVDTGSAITIKGGAATTLKARSVDFMVWAPSSLADASGKIVNADVSGIVAQGAGNIVAQGAGNIVAQGAGNFRAPTFSLQATQTNFLPVEGAAVQLFDLDDKPVGKLTVISRADGSLSIKGVPDGKPLVAVARWKQGKQIRRTSAVIGLGEAAMVALDPINHFVEARVRDVLAKSGKLGKVQPSQLKAVWNAFNRADIPLDEKLLADDATASDLIAFYKEQVAKLPCDDQKLVKDYMVELGADATPVTCN